MRLFLSFILFCAPCFSTFGAEQPNIIFFLADDLGWTDLGCYGSSFYESPNIDKLASEGMKFTQAYCAGSVCSPTRASIITGQVPARTGCTQYHGSIRGTELCFAEVLGKHGYETFFTGKWHVGGKTAEEAGFQTALGMAASARNPQDPKATRQITKNTLDFLSKQTLETPFMAYVSYHAVHKPLLEKQALVDKYQSKTTTHPPKAGLPKGLETEGNLENKQIQDDPFYAAMIEGIDASVGRILTFIKDNGFEDNTFVLFSSDNGGLSTKNCNSNLPLRAGKGWLYEGGVRVPTIMKWPSVVKPGSVSRVPIYSTDYFPTFLSAAGIPLLPEDHVDGYDLVPLLNDGTAPSRDTYYWHYPHDHKAGNEPSGSIRVGRYKLVTYFRTKKVELYDLENDVSELNDLSSAMPEETQELLAKLRTWQKTIPDISYGTPEQSNPLAGVRKQK